MTPRHAGFETTDVPNVGRIVAAMKAIEHPSGSEATVLTEFVEVFDADIAGFYLPVNSALEVEATTPASYWSTEAAQAMRERPRDSGAIGVALDRGEPVLVKDLEREARLGRYIPFAPDVLSEIILPVYSRAALRGVVVLSRCTSPFDSLDLAAASAGAAILGKVYEAAEAADEYREHVDRLRHEVRSPLQGILVQAEWLGLKVAPLVDIVPPASKPERHTVDRRIEDISEAVRHIENIIGTLDVEDPSPSAVQLRDTLHTCKGWLRGLAAENDIWVDVDQVPHRRLFMDQGQCVRMIYNLLQNALKYFDPSEDEHWVRVTFEGGPLHWGDIVFEDNGVGVARHETRTIFRNGVRGSNVIDRSTGNGRGLHYVAKICELHGGRVTLTNRAKPTRFVVRVPLYG